MKLIDLLVQELPKRGGWPKLAKDRISMHADGMIYFDGNRALGFNLPQCDDGWHGKLDCDYTNEVTREQYEAALAASEQPVWNGEGLPPIGVACEYNSESYGWVRCEIILYRKTIVIMESEIDGGGITITHTKDAEFRPIRTEAECQHDEFLSYCNEKPVNTYAELYDDIVAHKITGVTLVPTVSQIVRVTEKCSREDAERIITMLTGGTITE